MLTGSRRGSINADDFRIFDGTIAAGGTAQLVLPIQPRRAFLEIQNISTDILSVGIGPAKATATITSGRVASVAVDNGGIGYAVTPQVLFQGGIIDGYYDLAPPAYAPNYPFRPAIAQAVLSGGAVNAINVSDGGGGYLVAPLVYLYNPAPNLGGGAFLPSGTAGIQLDVGGSVTYDVGCPWSAVAIWGATTGQAYTCRVLLG